ncbi:MAG: NAD(P)/FAD-dependent oxidoreductase, partial [Pseudomonadota bacterium]
MLSQPEPSDAEAAQQTATMEATPNAAFDRWLASFDAALQSGDASDVAAMFAPTSYWRDMVAFTWNICTSEGPDAITRMVSAQRDATSPHGWERDGAATANAEGWVEAWMTFETVAGRGKAHARIVDGRCMTLLTTLTELHGHAPATGRNRARGSTHGAERGRAYDGDVRRATHDALGRETAPYVAIIGGGQGGLSLGARLKQLGVPALILETNARAGDSWRNRYPSLCLHDPVWYDHMPFIPFPDDWPVFTPRDRMGDWLEMYQRVMDLPYWTNAAVKGAQFDGGADDGAGRWAITVERDGATVPLEATHLVFATGMSGYPNVPDFAGRDTFAGTQLHSSAYRGGAPYAGQRAVVVGSNTSAHDIAADLWEHGCDVTMVQRSGTMVVQTETCLDVLLSPLYSEDALTRGIDTETADFIASTWPHRVLEQRHRDVCAEMRRRDADLHARLEKAGFLLDFGPDDTGLMMKSVRQGGGFYINVGASELICDGAIGLRSGVGIEALVSDGVLLADGSKLDADVVVYATGYRSMNEFVADIVGRDVADRVGRCWGVGSGIAKDPGPWEGELRNMWKPTAQPNLWFQGGNLAQSRHYSRFLKGKDQHAGHGGCTCS